MSQSVAFSRSNGSLVLGLARIGLAAGSMALAFGAAGCGSEGELPANLGEGGGGSAAAAGSGGTGGGAGGSEGGSGGTAGGAADGGTAGSGGGDVLCGNGVIDDDETCDTAIAAGDEGACPSSCDDADACTTDSLTGTACTQACGHGDITVNADGDGCCVEDLGNANTDSDCVDVCGNGVAEPNETCDTAIAEGDAGACPTACDDSDVCTADALVGDACTAACAAPPITAPTNGDGCCPGGANIGNDDDCSVDCGDGVWGDGVNAAGEACDTAIVSGPGSCPTACDDNNVCSTDRLDNPGTCDAICAAEPITAPTNGDGCCPDGANIGNDDDCTEVCGDGVRSGSENCDTAIPPGDPGSCPTSCDDTIACTADSIVNTGCNQACAFDPITTPANGDGCCPAGANIGGDDDCPIDCGDGVVSAPDETCDTAIVSGPGSCATSCDDQDVCTDDTLVNGGGCEAACTFPPRGADLNTADQCCPGGANLSSDIDCDPVCGDGIESPTTTPPETCDDGNQASGDGCSATCELEPVAFRFNELVIQDPHMFAKVVGFCVDIADTVNDAIAAGVTTDESDPADGLLDLSMVHVFLPFTQAAGETAPGFLAMPECTVPIATTQCTLPATETKTTADATNKGPGQNCLSVLNGTTDYGPIVEPVAPPDGTCYESDVGALTLSLGDIEIILEETFIGGEWSGVPATQINDGMIRGFLTEQVANDTILPNTMPDQVAGKRISELLNVSGIGCPGSQMDTAADGVTRGWYFYLNFTAVTVSYSEAP